MEKIQKEGINISTCQLELEALWQLSFLGRLRLLLCLQDASHNGFEGAFVIAAADMLLTCC